MQIKVEFELNRKWILDSEGEPIGETNFVVPAKWLRELYDVEYANNYDSLDEFLEIYEPETDGEFIYQKAIKDGILIDDTKGNDAKTIEEKVSIMVELEYLVSEWLDYIEDYGNECAYTDSILETIRKYANKI